MKYVAAEISKKSKATVQDIIDKVPDKYVDAKTLYEYLELKRTGQI